MLSEEVVLNFLAKQFNLPVYVATDFPEDLAVYNEWLASLALRIDWWSECPALAWPLNDTLVNVVVRNPFDTELQEVISKLFTEQAIEVQWGLATSRDLERFWERMEAFNKQFSRSVWAGDEVAYLRELAEEAPVIEYVNNLFAQAADKRASDIHIAPQRKYLSIHFRIDGVLVDYAQLPIERFNAIASRLKLIAQLDIAEKRLPQDGRIRIRAGSGEYDVRVSTLPGIHGESIVLRLLPTIRQDMQLESLGMLPDQIAMFNQLIHLPYGVFLVTGPTGSGKSTTLYSALGMVHDGSRKIITVEDPVEYNIEGITQIQINADIDLTFASVLRSALRQDPDILLVGEIRDLETARIAIQASLTGHLVLSTLHTNDSLSAFTRLIDMGVEPFMVATPAIAVMAQRLGRRLCPACAAKTEVPIEIIKEVKRRWPSELPQFEPDFKQAVGCSECNGSGYLGRIGFFELIPVTGVLRNAVIQQQTTSELWESVVEEARDLRLDGLLKAWSGQTTLEEVMRLCI
ncbi:MAG: type II secretion system protein [Proteobacteria bacterium]|nr:MAG: type II secretion system protein [Pseudomonadota bacterium]